MEFMLVKQEHLTSLCVMTEDAKAQLKRLGVDQWQKGYPNEEVWAGDLRRKISWVAVEHGNVLGAFMFQTAPEAAYANIDGAWLTDGEYASLHRVCVAEACKGTGVAGELFRHAFGLAKEAGLPSVRIDTHEGNLPMRRALEKAGFTCCGTIRLIGGNEDGDPRVAYEKILEPVRQAVRRLPSSLWQGGEGRNWHGFVTEMKFIGAGGHDIIQM